MSGKDDGLTADQFRSLIGDPPLMKGESVEEYRTWWMAFAADHKPKTLSDWFEMNELAHKRWEERRLRISAAARVESAWRSALRGLINQAHYKGIPEGLVKKYFGDDERARREARETVAEYGISEDQIRASAMEKCGKELLIFDRMEDYRARAIRQLRKEIDRREARTPPSSNQ